MSRTPPGKRRILHVLRGMNRGGVETWLMHVLRNIDRDRFQVDFLVNAEDECAYDREIQTLGSRIIRCPSPRNILAYTMAFHNAVSQHGPYDVIHSHVYYFSGYVLRMAYDLAIPVRIAHSHSNRAVDSTSVVRRIYVNTMKRWIRRYATVGLAVSDGAALSLFGAGWRNDPRWKVLYCGIDLNPFIGQVDGRLVRTELGLPLGAPVVGHVGRFSWEKNHDFLVDVASEVCRLEPEAHFLLVGDGPLRRAVEEKTVNRGLRDRFVFAGAREDVARLMMGAMDVFLFPSLVEGLPLALLEAQAAGLRCVVSDAVPVEASVVDSAVVRMPLSASPETWARRVCDNINRCEERTGNSVQVLAATPFNIVNSTHKLECIYDGSLDG